MIKCFMYDLDFPSLMQLYSAICFQMFNSVMTMFCIYACILLPSSTDLVSGEMMNQLDVRFVNNVKFSLAK